MDPDVTASLIKHRRTTLERIEKYISPIYFVDSNLYGKLYPLSRSIEGIIHWQVPGGVGSWENWAFDKIIQQNFTPAKVGDSFGPGWSTHWFKLSFTIPDEWKGKTIHLRWKSQSEAMVWSESGTPLQGLSSGTSSQMRTEYCLTPSWEPVNKPLVYYIEMAGSKMFGIGKGGMINPPNPNETFTLEMAQISVFDEEVYGFLMDLEVLHDFAKNYDEDQRGFRALYAGNQIINSLIAGDKQKAKRVAANFFSKKSGDESNTMALIGHCHIDSAWLWPYSETKRKCARSWSAQLSLMEKYPEMVFAASQAQQFDWMKQHYPQLFERIKSKARENKFVPTGATWVEMDGLLPSGESFIRQFLYGQKFYINEFGQPCKEFWLPDTFGYSGQIPQICRHFQISRFLTQKLSWSLVNKFPNHSFLWEGIDGSQVLAHFPPGDSYEMNVTAEEIIRTEKNFRDKGRSSICGFLYGYGDGGGGPTGHMLERAKRLQNVDSGSKVKHMTPDEMFTQLEKEKRNLCKWVGELYLELHNGTYTSQAKTKKLNRSCEFRARRAEMVLSFAAASKLLPKNVITRLRDACESAWKKVLLNQFHDVLPGSSIGIVYEDSDALFHDALKAFGDVEKEAMDAILDAPKESEDFVFQKDDGHDGDPSVLNTLPWSVEALVPLPPGAFQAEGTTGAIHTTLEGGRLGAIEAPPLALAEMKLLKPPAIKIDSVGGETVVENQHLLARFSPYGELLKLLDKHGPNRDVFFNHKDGTSSKGNLITLYDDIPLYWDAWDVMDYHLETRKILNNEQNADNITPIKITEQGPLLVRLQWRLKISDLSELQQTIELDAVSKFLTFKNDLRWGESRKFLKVEFETGFVAAKEASYDIQLGHIKRPTHFNTSWDSAKFEVCGHKWADISESDSGLAILNDCKYGWSARGALLALSLFRSPKAPDDNCDMGSHSFLYAAMPHHGGLQDAGVIQAAYQFNCPLVPNLISRRPAVTWFETKGDGVVLEAVKVAEDDPSSVILRFYESFGRSTQFSLTVPAHLFLRKVENCDGMERPIEEIEISEPNLKHEIDLVFSPFQLRSLRLTF